MLLEILKFKFQIDYTFKKSVLLFVIKKTIINVCSIVHIDPTQCTLCTCVVQMFINEDMSVHHNMHELCAQRTGCSMT